MPSDLRRMVKRWHPDRKPTGELWTAEEDALLRRLASFSTKPNFSKISEAFEFVRSASDCNARWQKIRKMTRALSSEAASAPAPDTAESGEGDPSTRKRTRSTAMAAMSTSPASTG